MKPLLNLLMTMVGITSLPVITGTFAGSKLGYDLFKTIDQIFEPSMFEEKTWVPMVDKKEEFDATIINVEMPGVPKANIKISAHTKPIAIFEMPAMTAQQGSILPNKIELCIIGIRNEDITYKTTIAVDDTTTADDIKAVYNDGLLTITVGKPGVANIPVV